MNKNLTLWLRKASLLLTLSVFTLSAPAKAFEAIEAAGNYPGLMGSVGQNFTSNVGGNVIVYFDRLLNPAVPNFISLGYQSFNVVSDNQSSFRLFPILLGADLRGKVFDDVYTSFGLAAGVSIGYLNVQNATTYNVNGYFHAQLKPAIEWSLGDSVSLIGRTPVNLVIGKATLTYLTLDLGLKFKL